MEHREFSSLLYRYFFFDWLFREVARGNVFERSAAWQHNKKQAHWMLTYLKRWTVLAGFLFASGGLCAVVFEEPWVCVPFFILFSVAIPIGSVIVVAWLGLRLLPKPLH